jgi:hypothetical protein
MKPTGLKCVDGEPLREAWRCATCGQGPIHPMKRSCTCSRVREGVLLCRGCAIAYDFKSKGHSRLTETELMTYKEWKQLEDRAFSVISTIWEAKSDRRN